MKTYNNEAHNNSNRQQSDVEIMYYKMQGIFGGNVPWDNLDFHAKSTFVNAINNVIQISQLRG